VFVSLERLAMPLDEGLQRHGRRPPILAGDEARCMTVQAVGESSAYTTNTDRRVVTTLTEYRQ
jgi:hypothetical protein